MIWNIVFILASGSIKACKTAALKCEESKFEQYKLMVGDRLSTDDAHRMHDYLEKIQVLEHWTKFCDQVNNQAFMW